MMKEYNKEGFTEVLVLLLLLILIAVLAFPIFFSDLLIQ